MTQNTIKIFTQTTDIFISGQRSGWKTALCFSFLCLIIGHIIGFLFYFLLHLSTVFSNAISFLISCSLAIVLSGLLFFFKSARCLAILFLLCCGMKEGRNALIATGTGIVLFYNVKNILSNLHILADSITCDLEEKRLSLRITPFDFYVTAIRRIYEKSIHLFSGSFFHQSFQCDVSISDGDLKDMLNQTKVHIQDVVGTVSSLLEFASFAGHIIIVIIGSSIVLLGTGLFLRKFLNSDVKTFEKSYITKSFVDYDNCRRQQNMASVLPLNKQEMKNYIIIPMLKTHMKEAKRMGLFFIPIFVNIAIWSIIMFIDFVLYWVIMTASKHLQELHPIIVPMTVSLTDQNTVVTLPFGTPDSTSEETLQIHLFHPKCSPQPQISLVNSWIPLSIIIAVLFTLGLLSSIMVQFKLLVVSSFYHDKELERVHYIHNKIIKRRSKVAFSTGRQWIPTIALRRQFWFPILEMKNVQHKQEFDA